MESIPPGINPTWNDFHLILIFQVMAWNYSHLEQPSTENIGNYTIDPAKVPSGLFAYYTCVDKG